MIERDFNPERLRELRESRGWSQTELADKLNVSKQTIHEYENGKKSPGRDKLYLMADLFNTSVDYIMGRTDIKEPIEELKKQIELNEPDIVDIMKNQKPHINGVPINEEQAEIFIEFLEAYYRRKLKEIEDEKNNQANKQ